MLFEKWNKKIEKSLIRFVSRAAFIKKEKDSSKLYINIRQYFGIALPHQKIIKRKGEDRKGKLPKEKKKIEKDKREDR